jgi:hypothetical protein
VTIARQVKIIRRTKDVSILALIKDQ